MRTPEIKKAYDRGYSAGRRKAKAISDAAKRDTFWQHSMLQVMEFCATQSSWKRGETPITGVEDRMRLAAEFAEAALNEATKRGRV
jgi:hypothetical protein